MGQIRAPKTALRPEGLDDTADERVKRRERVRLGDVTRQRGDFHGNVFQMSQLTKIIYGAIQWFALKRCAETHVIDDHAQSRMAFGDLAELQHGLRRKGHDRNVVALGCVRSEERRVGRGWRWVW